MFVNAGERGENEMTKIEIDFLQIGIFAVEMTQFLICVSDGWASSSIIHERSWRTKTIQVGKSRRMACIWSSITRSCTMNCRYNIHHPFILILKFAPGVFFSLYLSMHSIGTPLGITLDKYSYDTYWACCYYWAYYNLLVEPTRRFLCFGNAGCSK